MVKDYGKVNSLVKDQPLMRNQFGITNRFNLT